jgi:o-succinylbenzoate synthase
VTGVSPSPTPTPTPSPIPSSAELLDGSVVVGVPMRLRFRGLTVREAMLLRGPFGWAEFCPFPEYEDVEAARWLACAVEAGWQPPVPVRRDRVPVNATVPAVAPDQVAGVLARFGGCTTAKVKVAEPGQRLADDVARVAQVRAVLGSSGRIRVDANGAWGLDDALTALRALSRHGLEYAEQPCARLEDLARLRVGLARSGVDVPVAADESVRRAEDPLRVAVAGAADIVVIKVAPLGGVRAALQLAQRLSADHGLEVVVSSALETSVGLATGVRLAAALPDLPYACGLGTAALLGDDVVAQPVLPVGGTVGVGPVVPDAEAVRRLASAPERVQWWRERLERCVSYLSTRP